MNDMDKIEELRKEVEDEIDEMYKLSSVLSSIKTVFEYFAEKGKSI